MKATILIPSGFCGIHTGEIIQKGDYYFSFLSMEWVLFRSKIGHPLEVMPKGFPAIRPISNFIDTSHLEEGESQNGVKVPETAKATHPDATPCAPSFILSVSRPEIEKMVDTLIHTAMNVAHPVQGWSAEKDRAYHNAKLTEAKVALLEVYHKVGRCVHGTDWGMDCLECGDTSTFSVEHKKPDLSLSDSHPDSVWSIAMAKHNKQEVRKEGAVTRTDNNLIGNMTKAMVLAAMPLQAIVSSGRINDLSPALQVSVQEAIKAINDNLVNAPTPSDQTPLLVPGWLDLDALEAYMVDAISEKPDWPGLETAGIAWLELIRRIKAALISQAPKPTPTIEDSNSAVVLVKAWHEWKSLSDEANSTLSHQDGMEAQSAWDRLDNLMESLRGTI